ncbi:phosphoribosylanthranilate isomerase [Kutzneria sp. NPDC052558]|uniref:phosphoribosylanthranilate isomerase n=1 Tax=Kutzneria sp. NPDC052558 TaxID=3364121 RepID=UPI0037C9A64E
MASRTAVKICGLTRPEDVDAAVDAGADAIGFVLYPPSPRYVTPQRAAELAARLPAFVTPVLLFVNASVEEVAAAVAAVPGALLQFHGDETPEDCWAASQQGRLAFLRAARIPLDADTPPFDLVGFSKRFDRARAILVDAHVPGYGGGGRAFDWSLLPAAPDAHLVLSGGLTPDNVAAGIAALRPLCRTLSVDVSSGVEAAKGVKDPARIRAFVTAVASC